MGSYTAVEAIVRKGKIYPTEPGCLPEEGRVLLIVLEERRHKADPKKIKSLIGWLKTDLDAAKWQQETRSEWDARL
jgi:hypothetical protein